MTPPEPDRSGVSRRRPSGWPHSPNQRERSPRRDRVRAASGRPRPTLPRTTIGAGAGPAATRGRHHPGLAEQNGVVGREGQVHATGEGHPALADAQTLEREVDRDERGGARGVHRDSRTLQPKDVGESSGHDAVGDPRRGIGIDRDRSAWCRLNACGLRCNADEHAGPTPTFGRELQRARRPSHLEEQSLLRVPCLAS
jgi:hypothetical protein